ncbi:MAG: hypothetical protein LBD37_00050 [Treponema sp.]|jgi:Fe-S-cluster-containing dehydrogenase component|nr:hypothetical protein [Treponema sp.]
MADRVETAAEHILIRCGGCVQDACAVSCAFDAAAYIQGDLLIEASKCGACARKGFPIPACVAACRHGEDKRVVAEVPIEEKRRAAAGSLGLLRI